MRLLSGLLACFLLADVLGQVVLEVGVKTAFTNEPFSATCVAGLDGGAVGREYTLSVLLNGVYQGGETSLVPPDAATKVEVPVVADKAGETTVTCVVKVDNGADGVAEDSTSVKLQTIAPGVSLIPLIVVLLLAMMTRHVEASLCIGVFIGSCIINGSLKNGFKKLLDDFILGAVTDIWHQYIILFTLFLSGVVGMIQRSGGFEGMTNLLRKASVGKRSAQFCAILAGLLCFFDDYANCLMVGFSMRPLFDSLSISREKLAFIADGTAAPIASLVPISSWVGFEIGLIQEQLDAIKAYNNDTMPEGLSGSGFVVFLDSIPYRYYPIYMLFLQFILAAFRREFGPMLRAERHCEVYGRQDGGPGAAKHGKHMEVLNLAEKDTPKSAFNMLVPVLVLVILVLVVMVNTGTESFWDGADEGSAAPTVAQIFEGSDSFSALLYGTFGTALVTLLFYSVQFKRDGRFALPSLKASPVMSPKDSTEAFLFGMQKVFPAVVVLVLAWSVGSMMKQIGATRFLQEQILNGVNAGNLPTVTFFFSALMALATGTSWGTMEVIFPIVTLPAWQLSGEPALVVATIAAVLAGAVAGDHASLISDTTVLSATAAGCDLGEHFRTQAPYAIVVMVWAMLVGTLPVGIWAAGGSGYSTGVAIFLGLLMLLLTVGLLGVQVVSESARFDPITELWLLFRSRVLKSPDLGLEKLREDTKAYVAAGFQPISQPISQDGKAECASTSEKGLDGDSERPSSAAMSTF